MKPGKKKTKADLVKDLRMMMNHLIEAGWITGYDPKRDNPILGWTPHGEQCARFLRRIESDLGFPTDGMWAMLLCSCRECIPDDSDDALN